RRKQRTERAYAFMRCIRAPNAATEGLQHLREGEESDTRGQEVFNNNNNMARVTQSAVGVAAVDVWG
ncbi:unnamed protein product, partial [Arctogadus glacialis]